MLISAFWVVKGFVCVAGLVVAVISVSLTTVFVPVFTCVPPMDNVSVPYVASPSPKVLAGPKFRPVIVIAVVDVGPPPNCDPVDVPVITGPSYENAVKVFEV